MTKPLTMRSKITVRWTTNPADMGYDGRPSNWLTAPGETMSIRKAAEFAHALDQRVGQSVYKAIRYSNNGRDVTTSEINDVIGAWEYTRRFG